MCLNNMQGTERLLLCQDLLGTNVTAPLDVSIVINVQMGISIASLQNLLFNYMTETTVCHVIRVKQNLSSNYLHYYLIWDHRL